MQIKFKIVQFRDLDCICPYKIMLKENKWYKSWQYLLSETIGGDITHLTCNGIHRANEVISQIGNPFEYNAKIIEKVNKSKEKIETIKNF